MISKKVGLIAAGIATFGIVAAVAFMQYKKEDPYELQRLNGQANMGSTVYESAFEDTNEVYKAKTSSEIREDLDYLLKQNYTAENPLWVLNPFGTNESSLYVAFTTKKNCYLSYTISVDDEAIPDFTATAYIEDGASVTKNHEYNLVGLIPGMVNTVTLDLYDENDELVESYSSQFTVDEQETPVDLQLEITEGESSESVSTGLVTLFPASVSDTVLDILCYDDNGILRSRLPVISKMSTNIVQVGEDMVYAITGSKLVKVSPLGQVTKVYSLGDYSLHHDYQYNEELGELWVLATDDTKETYIEDVLIGVNLTSGEVRLVVDFEPLMQDIVDEAVKKDDSTSIDWLHVNSLSLMDSDTIIISARELSAIIKISNIANSPTIDYILADEFLFADTEEEGLLLQKDGGEDSFTSQYGQHSVIYQEDGSLEDGCYYLIMYNNNAGWSYTRPGIDWSQVTTAGTTLDGKKEEVSSYYYKYYVDENAGIYHLVTAIPVAYSGIVSNVQETEGNIIATSGRKNVLAEYDSSGTLIKSYMFESENSGFLYRGYKLTFNNIWFQER